METHLKQSMLDHKVCSNKQLQTLAILNNVLLFRFMCLYVQYVQEHNGLTPPSS